MGFLFYQDASVVQESGDRFMRAAVLIRPNWLVSASIERNDTALAFPQKTLLARFGGVAIDANFTFNEDEEEQEREVIQIVRPYNFTATEWWFYDITLLKTLLPFNITSAVAPIAPHYKRDANVRSCKILIYSRRSYNESDEILMQLSVELLTPSTDCGIHFQSETMICGADSEDNKNFNYETDYCQGNSGGPLLCEGEVTALQTYVNGECKQPHLFQLLAAWEKFIECGVEERCLDGECNGTCTTLNKDTPINEIVVQTTINTTATSTPERDTVYSEGTEQQTATGAPETEKASEDGDDSTPPTLTATSPDSTTTPAVETTETTLLSRLDEEQTTTWPSSKVSEDARGFDRSDDAENVDRHANVEAQQQMVMTKTRGDADVVHLSRSLVCLLVSLASVTLLYC
ncbi:unnamed protein product, partial [Iphiclides podalirius]